MNFSIFLFLIGILGFVLNRKNIILMLISIEIMLLAITFLILISSFNFDDILGQTFAIYIITIAGAESAIGLGILVAYYRLNFSLYFHYLFYSRKIFVKSINKFKGIRNYSTVSKNSEIDPWFITGLFDGEGYFVVSFTKNPRYTARCHVQARVQIKMHEIDRSLIEKFNIFFGIGSISKVNNRLMVEYRVNTLNDIINIIIPHFDNYPLKTKKYRDYLLLKKIILLMLKDEHKSIKGIQKIVNIKASLNTGLSKNLKEVFPHTIPIYKDVSLTSTEETNKNNLLNPKWVPGFCAGESNFYISVQESKTKVGFTTTLRFQ